MWLQSIILLVLSSVRSGRAVSCVRTNGWCTHGGSTPLLMDCDADGVADPVCTDTHGSFGYIGLTQGCRGLWPNQNCITKSGKICARQKGWCSHAGSTYFYQDCDKDGIPDPVCSDTNGRFGFIKSSQDCRKDEWPNGICNTYHGHSCRRMSKWCSHGGSTYAMIDCDSDGNPDPVCSDTTGRLGFIASSKGCHSVWPHATCRTKIGVVCARPKGWCSHGGSTFLFKDCDGDGIPDPICTDSKGNFGVVKSSQNCRAEWPHALCH